MKTKRGKNHIRARFFNRTWAVNLSVNGRPVNHRRRREGALYIYNPECGEEHEHALRRFIGTVAAAAIDSKHEPIQLGIGPVGECAETVIEQLVELLRGGVRLYATDGSRVKLNPDNLIVNLWLDENDPATAEVVDRIVGESPGGTVAGIAKMPDRQQGRKEDRARPNCTGARAARGPDISEE